MIFLTQSFRPATLGGAIEYLLQATTGSSSGLHAIENGAMRWKPQRPRTRELALEHLG